MNHKHIWNAWYHHSSVRFF